MTDCVLQNIESSLILNRASSSAASAANSGDLRFGGIDIGACGFESVLLNLGCGSSLFIHFSLYILRSCIIICIIILVQQHLIRCLLCVLQELRRHERRRQLMKHGIDDESEGAARRVR